MANQFPNTLNASEEDLQRLLATSAHVGTQRLEPAMERYVYKRRADGVHLINVRKTWEKLQLAARVIVTIDNPADVAVISNKPTGQRAVLKYARYTGAHAFAGRYTPGTFTNQFQPVFFEPRLLIVSDPRADHQPVLESSYVNIPVIAFCHTDSPINHVDIVIPCNNKGKASLGLMWWLLAREVNFLRNKLARGQPWDVMVDLFIYREASEENQEAEEKKTVGDVDVPEETQEVATFGQFGAPGADWSSEAPTGNWNTDSSAQGWNTTEAVAVADQ